MSDSLKKNLSQKNATKGALDRIAALEDSLPRIMQAMDQVLNQLNNRLDALEQVSEAVASHVGTEQVAATIVELRAKKAQDAADANAKSLAEAVEKGTVKLVDMVSEKALVVGRELDKDGNKVGSDPIQINYQQIKPAFQEQLLGQAVGYKLTTEAEGTFEVLAIYEAVEKPDVPEEVANTPPGEPVPMPIPTPVG